MSTKPQRSERTAWSSKIFSGKRLRKRFDGHIVALSLLIDFEGNSQHFDRKRLWPQRRRFWERGPRYWRSDHRGAVIGKMSDLCDRHVMWRKADLWEE